MNEKASLRKKIEIEFEVLKKERQTNLEKLLLKYKNRKAELENQQKQELNFLTNENLLKKSKLIFKAL
jgi:Holliday junction resolvase RusA-like endonuclease